MNEQPFVGAQLRTPQCKRPYVKVPPHSQKSDCGCDRTPAVKSVEGGQYTEDLHGTQGPEET
eukprot:885127-Amphidinium_carterae.1